MMVSVKPCWEQTIGKECLIQSEGEHKQTTIQREWMGNGAARALFTVAGFITDCPLCMSEADGDNDVQVQQLLTTTSNLIVVQVYTYTTYE